MASGAVGSLGQRNFRLDEQFAARVSEALAAARFLNLRRKCHISWFFSGTGFTGVALILFGLCAGRQFQLTPEPASFGLFFGGLALCVLLS
jgi:hypothetical protein